MIAAARVLAAAGLSLQKIAAALEVRGLVARTGKPFAAPQVQRMLG